LSFSDIARIRRKDFDVEEKESEVRSKRSQALKLIEEGKSDLDIAIQLDLSAKEMLEFRQEHLTLKNEDDLLRFYRQTNGKISVLEDIHEEMMIEDLSAEEAVQALVENRTFNQMTLKYQPLLKESHS